MSEWHIRIDNYEIDVELAHPTDIFWNTNAIFEKTEDEELIPDFTKLKIEKKEEIQLPSFAMDLGMGV